MVGELYRKCRIGRNKLLAALTYIRTPSGLATARGVDNVQKTGDHKCFLWSVLAQLYLQQSNRQRVSKYVPYSTALNMSGIVIPETINDISKFEVQKNLISINVLDCEEDDKYRIDQKIPSTLPNLNKDQSMLISYFCQTPKAEIITALSPE